MKKSLQFLRNVIAIGICLLLLSKSNIFAKNETEQVRTLTRLIEFDYVTWTLDALIVKYNQAALATPHYLPENLHHQLIEEYLSLVNLINATDEEIKNVFSDPNVANPSVKAAPLLEKSKNLKALRSWLSPLSESVLQQQVSATITELDLTLGGQPVPPLLYHVTPLPLALIISPKDIIRQDADISLHSNLSLEEIISLEEEVESSLNVSALVVNVGGVGVYPTMVLSTTDLPHLLEVIAHEWTHNYLTLRPLGINYYTSPDLRTMNETTASISGKEISQAVLERYYPEHLPPPTLALIQDSLDTFEQEDMPPVFDFRVEMHETRITVDQLLEKGMIKEAETYMEERRQLFWENGYQIRKLNQAYFAFHGAYADEPGGAAGRDPVGPAVRALRQQSGSLADFINRISWMTSFETLQEAIE